MIAERYLCTNCYSQTVTVYFIGTSDHFHYFKSSCIRCLEVVQWTIPLTER